MVKGGSQRARALTYRLPKGVVIVKDVKEFVCRSRGQTAIAHAKEGADPSAGSKTTRAAAGKGEANQQQQREGG